MAPLFAGGEGEEVQEIAPPHRLKDGAELMEAVLPMRANL